jgi:copper(I)-binding protein
MNARRMVVFTLAVAMSFALAACGDDDGGTAATTTTGAASAGAVEVTDVWARTSPATAANGAVYMKITNGTTEDDALVSASVASSVAAKVELHETVTDATSSTMAGGKGAGSGTTMRSGGMMTMQPVDRIEVKAGATVMLEPGGYHVMLFDLAEPLQEGATFDVTLTFEQAGTKTVEAEVRAS